MARGRLRKLFTDSQINEALYRAKGDYTEAAEILSETGNIVSRQLLAYWHQQLETSVPKANREIRETMQLRQPSPNDDIGKHSITENNHRILVIPDLHAPYQHPDTLQFLIDVASRVRFTRVISLGDETDGHAISFHDSDPNLDSAGVELEKAKDFLQKLARIFPVMDICHSNHGSLVFRRAHKSGLPVQYIKTYRDVLFPDGGGDGWSWHERLKVRLPNGDLCLFQHQSSGDILANAAHERANIVQGHEHGKFEIQYRSSNTALYWAMTSGCLVDRKSLAFAYGKLFPKKPIVGCSMIIDSQPVLIPMPMNAEGRYVGYITGILDEGLI